MWKRLNWFLVAGLNLAGGDLFAAAKTEVRLVHLSLTHTNHYAAAVAILEGQ